MGDFFVKGLCVCFMIMMVIAIGDIDKRLDGFQPIAEHHGERQIALLCRANGYD